MKEIILKTKRLILRKPKKGDWQDLMEGVGEYDVAKRTVGIPYPYTKKDAFWFINYALKKWQEKKQIGYTFFIELKSENKIIGSIGLDGINYFAGVAATGSWINKKYWRKGYMTEAKIAINDFAFNTLKLRRINSSVFTDNEASNATQKKIGYVFEGMRRKYQRSKATGKIHDENMYGLLKEDWKKSRIKLINKK